MRLADGSAHGSAGNVILTRFFRANFLAQLTNAQRRAALAGGFYFMRDLARDYASLNTDPKTGQPKDRVRAQMILNEFKDLGVADGDTDAFMGWLRSKEDGLPSLDDLGTPEGALFASTVARLTDQIITNPRRADKPFYAVSPYGRLIYSLTSFIYTFTRNMHLAISNRGLAEYALWRGEGEGVASAATKAALPHAGQFAAGFAAILTGQMIVSYFREMLFNAENFEEHEEEGDLYGWLFGLGLSRSGIAGPLDLLVQGFSGLRYERDLTSFSAGAHLGFMLSQVQNIWQGLFGARNSPNTNTSEHTAAKAFYRLVLSPMAAAGISVAPGGGPIMQALKTGSLFGATSNSAASNFANGLAGPRE